MSLDLRPGIYHGALVEVVEAEGTGLVGDHASGATVLNVAAGGFRTAGQCRVNGATYAYVREGDALTITPGLLAAADDGTPVESLTPAGEPETRKLAVVDLDMLGEEDDTGNEDANLPRAEIPGEWSGFYPLGPAAAGTFVNVEDTTYGYRVTGRPTDAPLLNGAAVDASTLDISAIPLTDGNAPTAATTVTPIGGIGSMFYRWTEVANADPVTYRLHVRAGSAPTTDGTYEVAAGVGLTSASVRKLKDGTAIVGDGTVTYHAIVTVEDADGPGPASTDVTGIPAQVNTADIAVNAITADHIQFNTLSGETVTGLNIQTAATGKRTSFDLDDFTFYSGDPDEQVPATFILQKVGSDFRFDLNGITAAGTVPVLQLITSVVGGVGSSRILFQADTIDFSGTIGAGDIGPGTFRDDLDARIASQSTDATEVTGLINSVGPTLTMTTGAVGTGAFRDSVRTAVMGDYAAGAWTTYTPTFTAATTNPTLANFTLAGRYSQRGKTVSFSVVITANAASGYGTGNYTFGLPVAARDPTEVVVTGNQGGPNRTYVGRGTGTGSTFQLFNTNTFAIMDSVGAGVISGTVLRVSGTYEAA